MRAVIALMSANRWERGKTAPGLAAEWGLAVSTVEGIAAEASRRIRSIVDPNEVKTTICVALAKGVGYAVAKRDVKGLAAVARTYAEITGALSAKKLEVTGRDGVPLGLPAVLAGLNPPPTMEEVEEFATTGKLPERPGSAPN